MMLIVAAFATAAPSAEQSAIFTAAGFKRAGAKWITECAQGGEPSYESGAIEAYRDLNGDSRPEAVVTEGGSFCYGNTGTGFKLLTKQTSGRWTVLYQSEGIAEFLPTRVVGNMPDISVGGPGFCFPVLRWNGKTYASSRFQYEGKPCRPNR